MSVPHLLRRFLSEDSCQDLVEYAMLLCFVAFAGAAAWLVFQNMIHDRYITFDTAEQGKWEPPDPQ